MCSHRYLIFKLTSLYTTSNDCCCFYCCCYSYCCHCYCYCCYSFWCCYSFCCCCCYCCCYSWYCYSHCCYSCCCYYPLWQGLYLEKYCKALVSYMSSGKSPLGIFDWIGFSFFAEWSEATFHPTVSDYCINHSIHLVKSWWGISLAWDHWYNIKGNQVALCGSIVDCSRKKIFWGSLELWLMTTCEVRVSESSYSYITVYVEQII